jgi:Ca-activated chloride channel family protein
MDASQDYYAVLGLNPDATPDDIKKVYRQLVRQYHPDAQQAAGTSMLFREVQAAYEVLSDPERRAAYDRLRAESGQSPESVFQLRLQFSRTPLLVIPEEQILYVLATLQPGQDSQHHLQRLPLNLCLVIDRSTSMHGSRLDQVKAAAHQLLETLDEHDTLAIVTFSDHAEIVWPNQPAGDSLRARAKVAAIQASGGTEILQGMQLGLAELDKRRSLTAINHMILLTDGQTYGDEEQCLAQAVEAKKRNISISCMGLGDDWNDVLLDAIASRSGGTSAYVATADDVQRIFQEHLHSLNTLYATDLQLIVREGQGIALRNAFRLTPYLMRLAAEKDVVPLGTLTVDNPIQLLMEFVVQPCQAGTHRLAMLELVGDVPILNRKGERIRQNLSLEFVPPSPTSMQMVPPAILSALAKITIFTMQETAWKSLDKGDVSEATRRLETMATRLLDLGEHQLARAALLEAGRLARSGHLSPAGRKAIKYGTRSLSLAPQERHHD